MREARGDKARIAYGCRERFRRLGFISGLLDGVHTLCTEGAREWGMSSIPNRFASPFVNGLYGEVQRVVVPPPVDPLFRFFGPSYYLYNPGSAPLW
jgi:hypothetical protein